MSWSTLLSKSYYYVSSFYLLYQVVKGLGISGMYQGTLATLSRDIPFSLIFFPLYANLKKVFADKKGENR